MSRPGRYHLKAKHEEAWKLIRHIRFLVNHKCLKQISHEGVEKEITYVCIILKDRVTHKNFDLIEKDLESLKLKMI